MLDGTWVRAEKGLRNARLNMSVIENYGLQVADVEFSKRTRESDTLLIFASGPSAMDHQYRLPQITDGRACFVSPTNAGWFETHAARRADLVVNVDSHESLSEMMEAVYPKWDSPPLATCPETDPGMIEQYGPDTFWFLYLPQDENSKLDGHPYAYFMRCLFGGVITHGFAQMGVVTLTMIAIAEFYKRKGILSYKRIVLIGCDFAYTDGFERLPVLGRDSVPLEVTEGPDVIEWDGMKTNLLMVMAKGNFLHYWPQIIAPVYSMGRGILHEFPPVTEKQVLRGQYPHYLTKKQRGKRIAAFGARLVELREELKKKGAV